MKVINKQIGLRMRELRTSMGLSRINVAQQIGITHQQLAKYENAQNRISASRLQDVAKILQTSTSYFLDENDNISPADHQVMALKLSRDFIKIKDPKSRALIISLVKILSKN